MTSDLGIEITMCQFPHMIVQITSLSISLSHKYTNKLTFPYSSGCGLLHLIKQGRQTLT
jgi:hypothetical protein